ncbi:MAG: STT3 domain-containing protein, partial [Campylobacterota bacterium]
MQSNRIKSWCIDNKLLLLYITVAYIFSVAIRFIWIYHVADIDSFYFNGQLMINTNDGYFYAKGAHDIIHDSFTQGSRSPIGTALAQVTAFLHFITPFSFETLILYMPAFFSSLLVIPLVLIGKLFHKLEIGFIAALIASIAVSYYNRTMIGYFDTDMLNIVLPTILLWSLMGAFLYKKDIYLLIIALDALIYRWWYPQSYALESAFIFFIFAVTLYKHFISKENITYYLKLLTLMLLATLLTYELLRLVGVFVLYYLFTKKDIERFVPYILAATVVIFYLLGGLDPIVGKLQGYVFREETAQEAQGLGLHFFTVMQTIKEAEAIPFETFAYRISGNSIIFILSMIGYALFCYRHKAMLLSLPMLGLGFLTFYGGLRFTIYAVPLAALGYAFLLFEITRYFKHSSLKYIVLLGAVAIALVLHIKHINEYRVSTVFYSQEVSVLDRLKEHVSPQDYTLAWWDYGYPIEYYSDTRTLIDGGRHGGKDNFIVSYILTSSQEKAAKMARLGVEYRLSEIELGQKNKTLPKEQRQKIFSSIERMSLDYGYKDTNIFLSKLTDIEVQKGTQDIYLYLPYRMSKLLPTIELFSNLDLMSGKKRQRSFYFESDRIDVRQGGIDFASGVRLHQRSATLQFADKQKDIAIYTEISGSLKSPQIKEQKIRQEGLVVVIDQRYKKAFIMDQKLYRSLYFQLFFLDRYDTDLFEKVIDDPYAKVFK